jgi:hypothetical protein
MSGLRLSTRDITLTAVFAVFSVVVCKVVPGIPIIGGSGSIKFDAALAPIYGLIIGPYLGALAALIGGVVSAGGYLSILTSFCTGISAFVAGMLTQRDFRLRGFKVGGWSVASLVFLSLISGWYVTWVGREAPFYPILHIIGLIVAVLFRGWIAEAFNENGRWRIGVAICLAAYCGIMADHMLGNLIYIAHYPMVNWPPIFMSVLPISTVERSLLTAIATMIGVSAILALRKANLLPRRFQT